MARGHFIAEIVAPLYYLADVHPRRVKEIL
jgi:hypothetical protein